MLSPARMDPKIEPSEKSSLFRMSSSTSAALTSFTASTRFAMSASSSLGGGGAGVDKSRKIELNVFLGLNLGKLQRDTI